MAGVTWSAAVLTDDEIDEALATMRERLPDARRSEIDWPEFHPALSDALAIRGASLRVDGHGHLYVFPLIRPGSDASERPVDVYAPDGELLFAGMIATTTWFKARGDFVYGMPVNERTDEQQIARYRLVEPFK